MVQDSKNYESRDKIFSGFDFPTVKKLGRVEICWEKYILKLAELSLINF